MNHFMQLYVVDVKLHMILISVLHAMYSAFVYSICPWQS